MTAKHLPTALTPIYPTTAGVPQAWLRKRIDRALQAVDLRDVLHDALRERLTLPALGPSLERLHHPPPQADAGALADRTDPAWQRLKFDELVAQQIALRLARAARQRRQAPVLRSDGLSARSAGGAAVCADVGAAACLARDRVRPGAHDIRCSGWCRAMSAAARPSWRRWPRRAPSKAAGRRR